MTLGPLSVSALGAIEIVAGQSHVSSWRYLDSLELLIFLLISTTASGRSPSLPGDLFGKNKEQIGQALWPDASPEQLDSNLKSRLHDLRTRLGAREWVLFESEQYKFNRTLPVTFDVDDFIASARAGQAQARAGLHADAIESYRRALAHYRGDFMSDYRKRRTAGRLQSGDDEIEWYVRKRYELQSEYNAAIDALGALYLEAGHFESAAEMFRKLIERDEYDDNAHRQLMLALAQQGKKSQALGHFRQLQKQRLDTPPEPELVRLADQIKRGEISAAAPPRAETSAVGFAAAPELPAPFQPPAALHRFVGRTHALQTLRDELDRLEPGKPLCLVGMGGIGKTSLAAQLAHSVRDRFPGGVLWGHSSTSEPMAILDSWARAYGNDYSTLPDLQSRAAALRSLLADKKVLFLIDDVFDPARVRPLLLNGDGHRVLITTRSADVAAALGGQVLEVSVFETAESADLLTRIIGASRVNAEPDAANEICALLGHLPLALDITASRLVSRPRWTLREMQTRLATQVKRLDEIQLGDRAVRASFAVSWDALTDAQRTIFAHLGAFNGRSLTPPALASVAATQENTAREQMDALVALSLLSFEGSARYRQHPLLADYAREKLDDPAAAATRLSQYYLQFVSDRQKNVVALDEEWDNIGAGIEIARSLEHWQSVIDYGDILHDAWIARGRFDQARRYYPVIMHAARELEEQDPYIAASLNWGKACIDQSDFAEAQQHLEHGLQTSVEVNDTYGMATAQFLLGRLAVVRKSYQDAESHLQASEELYQSLNDRAGLAQIYYMRARIQMETRNFTPAEEWASRSYELQSTLAPNHAQIVLLRYMGRIQSRLENVEQSLSYSNQALALAESLGDLGEYAAGIYDRAVILRDFERYSEAEEYAERSIIMMRRMGDRYSELLSHEEACTILFLQGKFDSSLPYSVKALDLAREINDTVGIQLDLLRLGDIYEKLGRLNEACQKRSEVFPMLVASKDSRTSEIQDWLAQYCFDREN